MSRTSFCLAASLASLCVLAAPMRAQSAPATGGHLVIVKLVTRAGSIPYAFEPASVTAQVGDTLRFIEDAAMLHNVRFTSHPRGSKLGAATTGPYLTTKGQTYDLLVDGRFTEGHYDFVCDPHATLGMHGELTVGKRAQ
jgi:plastocyanin